MKDKKEFSLSVADAVIQDIGTGEEVSDIIKTALNTSIKQEVQNKEINGGYGSRLQYEYDYNKKLSGELEDCQFKDNFWLLSNNKILQAKLANFFILDETHIVKDGKIELNELPVNKVTVFTDRDRYNVTSVGKIVSNLSFEDGEEVTCGYQYNTSVETFDIDEEAGKIVKLTYVSKIMSNEGLSKIMQIEIPRAKISGSFDLSGQHDGASTSKLTWKALEYNGKFATVKVKRMDGTNVLIQDIVANADELELHDTEEFPLEVIGFRGFNYGNIPIELSDLVITSSDDSVCTITDGKIVYTGNGSSIVKIELKSNSKIKDIINVTCS